MSDETPTEAIVPAANTELAIPEKRFWTSHGYKIVVGMRRKTMGLETVERPDKVMGQALGLRNDEQAFFASVDLPWIWQPNWEWTHLAKERLDTFLLPACECKASGGDVRQCGLHEKLNKSWNAVDAARAQSNREQMQQLDNMPLPTSATGAALDMLRVMHLNYPWTRFDVAANEWLCMICSARRQAYGNNPSYRNQFIFEHAKCGDGVAFNYKGPKVVNDVRTVAFDEVIDILKQCMERFGSGFNGLDQAHAMVRNRMLAGGDSAKYLELEAARRQGEFDQVMRDMGLDTLTITEGKDGHKEQH